MPRWLIESLVDWAILVFGFALAGLVLMVFAFIWWANGGALSSEPFDPIAQAVAGVVCLVLLYGIYRTAKWLLVKARLIGRRETPTSE